MTTKFLKNSGTTWVDELEKIKAAREELRQYGGMMTPYEVSTIQRGIKARVEASFQLIAGGAVGEYEAAIQKYKDSRQTYEREKQKEIQRWDTTRLREELTNAKTFMDFAFQGDSNPLRAGDVSRLEKIKKLVNEAQASGDIYKQRATFEVLQAVKTQKGDPDRVEVNQIVKDAAKSLDGLRFTDGMKQASEGITKSRDELLTTRNQLQITGEILGESFAFEKHLRRVDMDRQTGELIIHEPDSPEVTGVWFKSQIEE